MIIFQTLQPVSILKIVHILVQIAEISQRKLILQTESESIDKHYREQSLFFETLSFTMPKVTTRSNSSSTG